MNRTDEKELNYYKNLLWTLYYSSPVNFSTPRRGGGKGQWSAVKSKSKLRGNAKMKTISGVKSRAAIAAEVRQERLLLEARQNLAQIERFLKTLRAGNRDMYAMVLVVETERNELVNSNEVYMQAAAGLWCQSDEPQVLASNLNRERD